MYALFSIGVLGWLIYGIVTRTLPVVLANGVTLCFASVILAYKIKYK